MSPTPSSTTLTPSIFIALSSGLTGVSAGQLKPFLDPIGITDQYYAALLAGVPVATLDAITSLFLDAATPADGAEAILADPALAPVGRSIIKLWLLGVWYAPDAPTAPVNVISPQAYKASLGWRIMQSRPMRHGMLPFGDWAKTSPAFSQFSPSAKS